MTRAYGHIYTDDYFTFVFVSRLYVSDRLNRTCTEKRDSRDNQQQESKRASDPVTCTLPCEPLLLSRDVEVRGCVVKGPLRACVFPCERRCTCFVSVARVHVCVHVLPPSCHPSCPALARAGHVKFRRPDRKVNDSMLVLFRIVCYSLVVAV